MANSFNKFYTVTKTIGGKEVVAQFSGLSVATQSASRTKIEGTDNTSIEKLAEYLFDYVIVEPKLSLKDFGKDKIGTIEKKLIDGVEYEAKFSGLLTAVRAVDESYDDENEGTDIDKLAKYLFENVIVKPKELTVDDIEDINTFKKVIRFAQETMQGGDVWKEFNEIISFGNKVMNGQFRDKQDKKPTKETSKG